MPRAPCRLRQWMPGSQGGCSHPPVQNCGRRPPLPHLDSALNPPLSLAPAQPLPLPHDHNTDANRNDNDTTSLHLPFPPSSLFCSVLSLSLPFFFSFFPFSLFLPSFLISLPSQCAALMCGRCRRQQPRPLRRHQVGPPFRMVHAASAACTYKARPHFISYKYPGQERTST